MQLVVQTGPDAGKVFMIDRPLLVIGRQAGCDVLLNDPQISRRHLQLETRDGQLFISDLGSANGSNVNGQTLIPNQPRPLQPGDLIRLGNSTLAVQTQPAVVGTPPPVYNQPYNQPPVQFSPQPGPYPPVNQYPQPYPVQPVPPYPGYGSAPAAYQPVQPAKPKKNTGLIIGGVVLALILVVGLVTFLAANANRSSTTAITAPLAPTGSATNSTTVDAIPTVTVIRGQSGSNPPPPSPPVSGAVLGNTGQLALAAPSSGSQ